VSPHDQEPARQPPPVPLDTAVRRRRADEEFFLRIGRAIWLNERAVERLSR
jgi:hypothetical protein